MKRVLAFSEIFIICCIALLPVLGTFPYRLNIFLSYEGAYRLYQGELPYRDFGIPLGFMYWVVPAVFFKIFGPYLITLVKAQALLNIIAGLSFRSILKSLGVNGGVRFVSVLLFVFSYSFLNYWPWYNHSVIVYELVALAFLMKYLFATPSKTSWWYLMLAALFVNISFFTKQDGGGMALLICLALLGYDAWLSKKWKPMLLFTATVFIIGVIMILPFLPYRFGYWFNHGQPPHSARVSPMDIANDFFGTSQWIRFYLFMVVLICMAGFTSWKAFFSNKRKMIFTLLTLGILTEAAIFQVTSYVPQDNNIFFHSFAFAFLLVMLLEYLPVDFNKWPTIIISSMCILLWWSNVYWRYAEKFASKLLGAPQAGVGVVNKNTYLIFKPDTTEVPLHLWRSVPLKSFKGMLLPGPTVDGMNRIMQMPQFKQPEAKVLNMSELTPLVNELHYTLEKGDHYPLWYHQGVGMFQKETDMFCNRISQQYYDVVLFEYIPYLNNFYPFKVREALLQHYEQADRFTAPRKPSNQAWVEVYVRKKK